MDLLSPRTVLLLAATFGYAAATMNMTVKPPRISRLGMALLVAGFVAASSTEVALMRGISLGPLYLMILGLEALMVLGYSVAIGERFSRFQITGSGLALASLVVFVH